MKIGRIVLTVSDDARAEISGVDLSPEELADVLDLVRALPPFRESAKPAPGVSHVADVL